MDRHGCLPLRGGVLHFFQRFLQRHCRVGGGRLEIGDVALQFHNRLLFLAGLSLRRSSLADSVDGRGLRLLGGLLRLLPVLLQLLQLLGQLLDLLLLRGYSVLQDLKVRSRRWRRCRRLMLLRWRR